MDRVETSLKYASECQKIITKYGNEYKKGSELIERIAVPDSLHPMLTPIADIAYDIVADFRGDDNDLYNWNNIKIKVDHFLANKWESTAWWAVIMYGLERDGIVSHTYSLSIKRQGAAMTLDSGSERLAGVIKELSDTLDPNQTDEWFIYSLLSQLPEKINELQLQSTQISEVTVDKFDKIT